MADDVTERARELWLAIGETALDNVHSISGAIANAQGLIAAALRVEYERGLEAAEKVCRKIATEEQWDRLAIVADNCADSIATLRQPPPTQDPSGGKPSG